MKTLKFAEPLPSLILSGKKDTTWRINDEKDLEVNDELSLCFINKQQFARAKILWIKQTTFERLTNEDLEGHEKFSSLEDMYKTYTKYYKQEVKPNTKLKVIKFELL